MLVATLCYVALGGDVQSGSVTAAMVGRVSDFERAPTCLRPGISPRTAM